MLDVEGVARAVVLAAFLVTAASPARSEPGGATPAKSKAAAGTTKKKTATKRDPRTVGLGRSCAKRADCSSKAQVCLRQQDQRGKKLARGFCALPCASLEHGLTKTRPGFPAKDPATTEKLLRRPPPPRCPAKFKCLTKGGNVPIDMCVRE
jgi:hypothetical protein